MFFFSDFAPSTSGFGMASTSNGHLIDNSTATNSYPMKMEPAA